VASTPEFVGFFGGPFAKLGGDLKEEFVREGEEG